MSDQVIMTIVQACSNVPMAIAAIAAGWFSYKAAEHSKEAAQTAKEVAKNTDGITTKLVELTAKASHAEGVLEAKENGK